MGEESSDEPRASAPEEGDVGEHDGSPSPSEPDADDEELDPHGGPTTPEGVDEKEQSHGRDLSDEDVADLEDDWNPRSGASEDEDGDGDGDGDKAAPDWPHAVGDHRSGGADGDADANADTDADDADADADGQTVTDPADEFDDVGMTTPSYGSPVDPHAAPDQQAKSDGGYANGTGTSTGTGTGTGTGTAGSEYDVPDEAFDGPASDQEMPLADHIEEMVKRLGVVLVVMAIVSGIIFPFGAEIINFLWYSILDSSLVAGSEVPQPRVYAPLALILARLKVATLAGFVVGLPVFVYETYLFMRPGLYPKERRYYLASVPTSLVLATVGVLFAYFLVLPFLFTYFLGYTENAAEIAFGLTETFDLMVLMLGWFALIFQIPLFVALALMMGIVSRRWMAARRLYFWGAFVGIAFLFAPDPTGMAPILVAATMIALFEGTLFLDKWAKRGRDALFDYLS
jgi:sec-independent protein translocase protein TatC